MYKLAAKVCIFYLPNTDVASQVLHSYPTPTQHGSVKIIKADDTKLTLQATDGTQFTFDLNTRTYGTFLTAEKVIQSYFQAINDKKYEQAISYLSSDFVKNEKDYISFLKHINLVKNLQIELPGKMANGKTLPETNQYKIYDVTFDLELDQKVVGAYEAGKNERFIALENTKKGWEITAFGTGP